MPSRVDSGWKSLKQKDRNELIINLNSLPPTDSRVAHAVEEESERNGSRHGQIQQHKPGASEADPRVTCVTRVGGV